MYPQPELSLTASHKLLCHWQLHQSEKFVASLRIVTIVPRQVNPDLNGSINVAFTKIGLIYN